MTRKSQKRKFRINILKEIKVVVVTKPPQCIVLASGEASNGVGK